MPKGRRRKNKKRIWRKIEASVLPEPLTEDPAEALYQKLKKMDLEHWWKKKREREERDL